MKSMKHFCTLIFFFSLGIKLHSQSLESHFSKQGLVISSLHYNQFQQEPSSLAVSFIQKEEIAGKTYLKYIQNRTGAFQYFLVQGDKMYQHFCQQQDPVMLFDFGVNVGDSIKTGPYAYSIVTSKEQYQLANGEKRRSYKVKRSGQQRTIVEGIGDLKSGLTPNFNDFEGYDDFVCAKIGNTVLYQNPAYTSEDCETYSCILPVPKFDFEIDSTTVIIKNQTLYGNTYLWDFGDGTTSSEENPIHTYAEAGCFEIKLTAQNQCEGGIKSDSAKAPLCKNNAWELIQSFDDGPLKTIYQPTPNLTLMFGGNLVLTSKDGGKTWKRSSIIQNGKSRVITKILMWDDQKGVLITNWSNSSNNKSIFITSDGGETWAETGPIVYYLTDIEIAPNGVVYGVEGSYSDDFYRSVDYGKTWEILKLNQSEYLWEILKVKNDTLICSGYYFWPDKRDYIISRSEDRGLTWKTYNLPKEAQLTEFKFFDLYRGYGYGNNGNIYSTDDGGKSWKEVASSIDVYNPSIASPKVALVFDSYVAKDRVLYYTTDGFQTTTATNCGFDSLNNPVLINDTTAYAFQYSADFKRTKVWKFNFQNLGVCKNLIDEDGDGFTADVDCDDTNNSIHPEAVEIQGNGVDENCDGTDTLPVVEEELDQYKVILKPNPASSYLQIKFKTSRKEPLHIEILNLYGQVLRSEWLPQASMQHEMDCGELGAGLYILSINWEEGKRTQNKFMVVR